jgi:hypothetical protein
MLLAMDEDEDQSAPPGSDDPVTSPSGQTLCEQAALPNQETLPNRQAIGTPRRETASAAEELLGKCVRRTWTGNATSR